VRALVTTLDGDEPLVIRDVPDPVTRDDEIVIEVRAGSLNRGELRLIESRPDWRPGQDIAGVVVRSAADGTGPGTGTRVAAAIDHAGWAELAAVPVNRCCSLPDGVTFEAGATLGVAGLTALRSLRAGGSLLGSRVLVTGAAGGVGRFAIQLAHAGGASVTAVVGDESRGEGLDRLGASEIVLEDGEHTEPFDLVLDAVGGPVLERAVRALGPGAIAVLFGMASGERARIGLFDFQHGAGARLQPFRLYRTDVDTFGDDLGFLARSIGAGRIEAPIGLQVSWSELPRAMEALRARQVRGKVVFTMDRA